MFSLNKRLLLTRKLSEKFSSNVLSSEFNKLNYNIRFIGESSITYRMYRILLYVYENETFIIISDRNDLNYDKIVTNINWSKIMKDTGYNFSKNYDENIYLLSTKIQEDTLNLYVVGDSQYWLKITEIFNINYLEEYGNELINLDFKEEFGLKMKRIADNSLMNLEQHKELIENEAKKGKYSLIIQYNADNEEIYQELREELVECNKNDDNTITISWN